MPWNPSYKPKLRPVEAFRVKDDNGADIGLRDRSGLSDVVLTLSEPVLHVFTMMDGTNSCAQIQERFAEAFDQPLSDETFQPMLDHLNEAHLLEGEHFDRFYTASQDNYREQPVRIMRDADGLGIRDGSGDLFDDMLADAKGADTPQAIVGLIAPHLDYPRGRPCYAPAYAALRDRPAPDRVIILGTNHFGRSTSVVATGKSFATPLGVSEVDTTLLARLEEQCGGLRTFELDHAREHSIELQVAWLQHLFGADRFKILPLLCPDPCGPDGTKSVDGQGVEFLSFVGALRQFLSEDEQDTLLVAGADLSHVGQAFGDERALEPGYLREVEEHDRDALGALVAKGPDAMVQRIVKRDNETSICSAGCMFVLAKALPSATATLLAYHQAVDQPSQTCVTCAAVAFTEAV